jgi:hypothetical protein
VYAVVKLEVLTNWEVLRKIDRYTKKLTAIYSYVVVAAFRV